jgi:hypothetical protein
MTDLGPVRNSQEGHSPWSLGHQESVDVDPVQDRDHPTLFLPDCATGDNRTLGLHLRALESVQ